MKPPNKVTKRNRENIRASPLKGSCGLINIIAFIKVMNCIDVCLFMMLYNDFYSIGMIGTCSFHRYFDSIYRSAIIVTRPCN